MTHSAAARRPNRSAQFLAGMLAVAGSAHFISPGTYGQMIPTFLGSPEAWVYGSGVLELVCAAGVAYPSTRRLAAWGSAALFVGVFPGNLTMALSSGDHSGWYQAGAWARLPLQIPLVWWAVSVARSASNEVPVEQESVVREESSKLEPDERAESVRNKLRSASDQER